MQKDEQIGGRRRSGISKEIACKNEGNVAVEAGEKNVKKMVRKR